ncbi:MAG: DUF4168 domain-containing protein [Spirochaetaceae bacterium]|nr:MAG: DUF4168 domain-containing protein [Spirochaetaceae bacterium]
MKRYRTDKTTRLIIAVLVVLMAVAGVAAAQVNPESSEFENFAGALIRVQDIQQSTNAEIEQIIAAAPIDDTRFMEIHQEVQTTGAVPPTVEQSEAVAYQETVDEIGEIQMASQEQMIALVEDVGLSVARFNELVNEVQRNPELQQALERLQ